MSELFVSTIHEMRSFYGSNLRIEEAEPSEAEDFERLESEGVAVEENEETGERYITLQGYLNYLEARERATNPFIFLEESYGLLTDQYDRENAQNIDLLLNGTEQERVEAARALGNSGGEMNIIFSALQNALSDPSAEVRAEAVTSLGSYGDEGYPLIETLRRDPYPQVRVAAVSALAELSGLNIDALEALRDTIRNDTSSEVRIAAMNSLRPLLTENISIFMAALIDDDINVAESAQHALEENYEGIPSFNLIPKLRNALRRNLNPLARIRVINLMSFYNQAVPDLIAATRNENPEVRVAAVRGLGGEWSETGAEEALVAALSDEDVIVREASVEALGNGRCWRNQHTEASLINVLMNGDEDITVREEAIRGLGHSNNGRDVLESLVNNEQEPQSLRIVAEEELEEISVIGGRARCWL